MLQNMWIPPMGFIQGDKIQVDPKDFLEPCLCISLGALRISNIRNHHETCVAPIVRGPPPYLSQQFDAQN